MRTRCSDASDLHAWIIDHDPLAVAPLCEDPNESGFEARSPYVEHYWLPILGPSCVFAIRRLAEALERNPDGFELPLAAFARSLGLGAGIGRSSPVVRTLARLDDFGFAHAGWDRYAVRRVVPALSHQQVRRLPEFLAELHRREVARPAVVFAVAP